MSEIFDENIVLNKRCSKCGGELIIDHEVLLLSNPPKYKLTCKKCNNVEYISQRKYFNLKTIRDL